MAKRSIQAERTAMQAASVYVPPITAPSRPEVADIYRGVMASIPSDNRSMASMRALGLEAAEAIAQIERMDALLVEQGEIQRDHRGIMRPHPAVEIRHKAGMRLMALMTKLRLVPSQDTRDMQQRAKFEESRSSAFSGGSITNFDPVPLKANGEPDWIAYRKRKNASH